MATNFTDYAQLGLTMEYFDRLMTGKISFGNHKIRQWLNPKASTKSCGFLGWDRCNVSGWQDLSASDVRFGLSRKNRHSSASVPNHTTTNITSYVNFPGDERGTELLARDWSTESNKKDNVEIMWLAAQNSKENPLTAYNPLKSYDHQYKNSSFPFSLDFSNVNSGGIEISAIPGTLKRTSTRAKINVESVASEPTGSAISLQFTYRPGETPVLRREYVSSNAMTVSVTDGWDESSTKSGEVSHAVTDTVRKSISSETSVKVKAGLDEANGVEGEQKLSISEEREKSITNSVSRGWEKMQAINFSENNSQTITTETTSEVLFDLNDLKDNGDGTYGGVPKIESGDPSIDLKTKFKKENKDVVEFHPGQEYRVSLLQTQSAIDNVVTGDFEVFGSAGTLTDNYNKTPVSMSAAKALWIAKNHYADQIFRNSTGSIDPDDKFKTGQKSIAFRGSAEIGSSISTDFTLRVHNVIDPQIALEDSSSNNLSLINTESHHANYDLGLVDNKIVKSGHGYWLALETEMEESVTIKGDKKGNSMIHASNEGYHQFINHKDTHLHGNENADTFDFSRKWAKGNHVFAYGGDDFVTTKTSQTALLGDGDDIYNIKGQNTYHQVSFGDGKDQLVLEEVKGNYFKISDFSYVDDVISVSGSLNPKKLQANLVTPKKSENLDGAILKFRYDGKKIGEAHVDHSESADLALNDIEKYFELAYLNTHVFSLKPLFQFFNQGKQMSQSEIYAHLLEDNKIFSKYTRSVDDWANWTNAEKADVLAESASMTTRGKKIPAKAIEEALNSLPYSKTDVYSFDVIEEIAPLVEF